MSHKKLVKAIYPEIEVPIDNPESYYLLRLADLYGEELLEEYLEEECLEEEFLEKDTATEIITYYEHPVNA